jgi:hypothetical protein
MALGLTQQLTEMSTRKLPRLKGVRRPKTDNLTAICKSIVLENVGASTSHKSIGIPGLLRK